MWEVLESAELNKTSDSSMNKMTVAQTEALLKAAQAKAKELGVTVCIAVADDGANLKGFVRMDGAFLGSTDVAIGKAKTACLFPVATGDFGELVRSENLTGMELSNGGLVCFPGGHPINTAGQLYGAIGVSGATAEQDDAIASYAMGEVF